MASKNIWEYVKNKKGQAIRIDIRFIKKENALQFLHFTLQEVVSLIKNMRTYAKNDYKLNEYGIYKKIDGVSSLKNIKQKNDIFKELGLNYIVPEKRTEFVNFNNLKFE